LIKKKFNLFENNENLNNVLEQRWESNVIEKQKKKKSKKKTLWIKIETLKRKLNC
jgi:hypothetical protein